MSHDYYGRAFEELAGSGRRDDAPAASPANVDVLLHVPEEKVTTILLEQSGSGPHVHDETIIVQRVRCFVCVQWQLATPMLTAAFNAQTQPGECMINWPSNR